MICVIALVASVVVVGFFLAKPNDPKQKVEQAERERPERKREDEAGHVLLPERGEREHGKHNASSTPLPAKIKESAQWAVCLILFGLVVAGAWFYNHSQKKEAERKAAIFRQFDWQITPNDVKIYPHHPDWKKRVDDINKKYR